MIMFLCFESETKGENCDFVVDKLYLEHFLMIFIMMNNKGDLCSTPVCLIQRASKVMMYAPSQYQLGSDVTYASFAFN